MPPLFAIDLVKIDLSGRICSREEMLGALLRPKQFVYVDSSSTNLAFARVFPRSPLTVATHDPAIAAGVMGSPRSNCC
jgi:DeoR/GlpR family transcriptional regulator of sugar metabolism